LCGGVLAFCDIPTLIEEISRSLPIVGASMGNGAASWINGQNRFNFERPRGTREQPALAAVVGSSM
jgi:hypothetical protein